MLESILIMGIYFVFIAVAFILALPVAYIIYRTITEEKISFINFIKSI